MLSYFTNSPTLSSFSSYLSMYTPKGVSDGYHPCLTQLMLVKNKLKFHLQCMYSISTSHRFKILQVYIYLVFWVLLRSRKMPKGQNIIKAFLKSMKQQYNPLPFKWVHYRSNITNMINLSMGFLNQLAHKLSYKESNC